MTASVQRVQLQPAYVLHRRSYRDTSRILELFTRDHGRTALFARGIRGAKRAAGTLSSVLQPFQRILVSFSSRGEAGQLHGAEFDGAFEPLPAARSLSGFYINELILRLLERHDAHADVFALYDATIEALKSSASDESAVLRIFEKRLLEYLGYGLSLNREAQTGEAVFAERIYRYVPERGVVRIDGVAEDIGVFSGASLLALHAEQLVDAGAKADARRLLKSALGQYLSGRELQSPQVLRGLRKIQQRPQIK